MNKSEDKEIIKSLEESEVEKVSGGKLEESKKYTGPTPKFEYPILTKYGMPSPKIDHFVAMKYGMPTPKKIKLATDSDKIEDKETEN